MENSDLLVRLEGAEGVEDVRGACMPSAASEVSQRQQSTRPTDSRRGCNRA